MNDEIRERIGIVNSKKTRPQLNNKTENNESVSAGERCDFLIQDDLATEATCSSSCTILNGIIVNNLNNYSYSNGYSNVRLKENIDNCKPQNGLCKTNSSKESVNSLYRTIYNSSSEDDDEHCVYTYKGSEVGSDQPETIFHKGINVQNNRDGTSECSSPEMDFLEMDFDPGLSNGQDSDSDNVSLNQNFSSNENINETYIDHKADTTDNENVSNKAKDQGANADLGEISMNRKIDSAGVELDLVNMSTRQSIDYERPCCSKSLSSTECKIEKTENTTNPLTTLNHNYLANSSDEEISSLDNSQLMCDFDTPKILSDSYQEALTFIPDDFNNSFIENQSEESEASLNIFATEATINEDDLVCFEDLLPLDPSYSISAIFNVMKILNIKHNSESNRELLTLSLRSRQIPDNAPLVQYLFMQAVQNANEVDLAKFSLSILSDQLHSRFFSTYPRSHFDLFEWLRSWMKKGAVPVVTRNIQGRSALVAKNIIQNPWRHNVVYKLEAPYVHLSNPSEKIVAHLLHSQLSQPSLVYIKREYVLEKWHPKVDLRLLTRANHDRWYNENVLGQVATIIRENSCGLQTTQYVRVPSNCVCGITLFVPSENVGLCKEVDEALELTVSCY